MAIAGSNKKSASVNPATAVRTVRLLPTTPGNRFTFA